MEESLINHSRIIKIAPFNQDNAQELLVKVDQFFPYNNLSDVQYFLIGLVYMNGLILY